MYLRKKTRTTAQWDQTVKNLTSSASLDFHFKVRKKTEQYSMFTDFPLFLL